jgi:putative Mg2+ transporter-C (MgtC) family protein
LGDELFFLPDAGHITRVTVRLAIAAILGGILGAERESVGKAAGLRTHMLVALGGAMFVLAPAEMGMAADDMSRVIQGVATGIGFIGAGTILKRHESEDILGLTTAANIWLTAAIGIAVGLGRLWLPIVCVAFAWFVLVVVAKVQERFDPRGRRHGNSRA